MMKLRKDVKTGLVVAGGVLAVGVIYVALGRKSPDAQQVDGNQPKIHTTESGKPEDNLNPPGAEDRPIDPNRGGPEKPAGPLVTQTPAEPIPTPPAPTPTSPGNTAPPSTPSANTTAINDPWEKLLFEGRVPPLSAEQQRDPIIANTPGSTEPTPEPVAPPSRTSTPPAVASARTHTVVAGETLAAIAKHYYGSERAYLAILKANPSVVPERLRVGTTLNLPDTTEAGSAAPVAPAPVVEKALDSQSEYRVRPGDSLHRIARTLYGDDRLWQQILDANKTTLSDPAKLKVGQVLKLPTPPTTPTASR